ncbi:MAG: DUF111 family protein [Eubacterium sp.]|nr:DUF111 family protein [Eubacterium sp.]
MKKVIYFDCYMGISGDMVLGACLDLGVDEEALKTELRKLHIEGIDLSVKKMLKNGFTGTDVEVLSKEDGLPVDHLHDHVHGEHVHHHDHEHIHDHDHFHDHTHEHTHEHSHTHAHEHTHHHDHDHEHRTLSEIRNLIMGSDLEDAVKETAMDIFYVIAEAEAKVHGKPIEEVGFHEVGAIDSIVDICGAAICLHLLGVEKVYCSVVREGTGFIMCQHGQLPVPVPAVANMMPGSGIIVKQTDEVHTELVTPTGFGILKGTKAICGTMPEMMVESVGLGFGKRDVGRLNGLRAVYGTIMEEDDELPEIHYDDHVECEEAHTHVHADGTVHTHTHEGHHEHSHAHGHTHDHGHGHGHVHSAEHTTRVRNRLAKAIGHLERVKHMVEEDRDCAEVLIQLAAVKSALNNTGKEILKEHMSHCLIEAIEKKEFSEIEELNKAIDQFIK